MLDSCSIIIRKPLGHEYVTLAVRAAWAMLTVSGLEVKCVLLGDGVYGALAKGGYVKEMFERFLAEGGVVYAVQEDLAERGLEASSLPEGAQTVAAAEVSEIVLETDSVMTF